MMWDEWEVDKKFKKISRNKHTTNKIISKILLKYSKQLAPSVQVYHKNVKI